MPDPTTHHFTKLNGLGNEIVVIDLRSSAKVFSNAEARAIATRPGSHFDQLMVLHAPRTSGTAAYIRIHNTDGSEAGACGNGMRCVAWMESQATGAKAMTFETVAGLLDASIASIDRISVDMGEPRFHWSDIPLAEPFRDTRAIELQVGPIDAPLIHSPSVVNVGNPHAVFWVDRLDIVDLAKVGAMLEHHPLFPARANISLAKVVSRTAVSIATWERGAGLTRACGSAACAAAVCAARRNLTARRVTITLPGGDLEIDWRADNHVIMTGPVMLEHEGSLGPADLAAI